MRRLHAGRWLPAGVLCLAGLLSAFGPARVWGTPVDENQLKVALLYKLVKFVGWPDSKGRRQGGNFDICVLGGGRIAEQLMALQGKKTKGRSIRILQLKNGRVTADQCSVLFVSKNTQTDVWREAGKGVLTVSDRNGFAADSGILELRRQGKRIRFVINRGRAGKADLSFPAQVLALAIIVNDEEGRE